MYGPIYISLSILCIIDGLRQCCLSIIILLSFENDLIVDYVMMLSWSTEKRKQEVSELQAGLDDADVLVTLSFSRYSVRILLISNHK